ncbi:hypothetical protein D3C75_227070 [compost metagenome]
MRRRVASQVFGGLILIGIGVLFLLRQLGYVSYDIGDLFSDFWPVILIILGIQGLLRGLEHGRGGSFIGPLILLLIGLYFLGDNLDVVDLSAGDFFTLLIPLALILGGLKVIFKPRRPGPPAPPPPAPQNYFPREGQDIEPPKPLESTLDDEFERKFGNTRMDGKSGGSGVSYDNEGRRHVTDWDQYLSKDEEDEDLQGPRDPWQEKKEWVERRRLDREERHERRHQEREERHERRHQEREERHERRHQERHERRGSERSGHGQDWHHGDNKETTNRSTFIGDIHMGREHFQLKHTNISLFIGDTVLDLTNAQIPYGETKINLSAFIGDLKVYIPDDMDLGISVNSSSFIGDMDVLNESRSGFMSSLQYKTPYYKEAGKKIRINVSAFIGDIKVKTVG